MPIDLFNVDSIKSVYNKRKGIAKQNLFNVIFAPPSIAQFSDSALESIVKTPNDTRFPSRSDTYDINFLCENCSISGEQYMTVEGATTDLSHKYVYGYLQEDITFTFYLTNDFYVFKVFDEWTRCMINKDRYRLRYKSTYTTDIIIQQLAASGDVIHSVKLLEAYPVSVSGIILDNTSTNSVQRIIVTVTYKKQVVDNGITGLIFGNKIFGDINVDSVPILQNVLNNQYVLEAQNGINAINGSIGDSLNELQGLQNTVDPTSNFALADLYQNKYNILPQDNFVGDLIVSTATDFLNEKVGNKLGVDVGRIASDPVGALNSKLQSEYAKNSTINKLTQSSPTIANLESKLRTAINF